MLREHMQLTRDECHIGAMTAEQCKAVERFARRHLNERAAAVRGDKLTPPSNALTQTLDEYVVSRAAEGREP
jgi:uncharacterized Zn-binding protein involved in type VI secretion